MCGRSGGYLFFSVYVSFVDMSLRVYIHPCYSPACVSLIVFMSLLVAVSSWKCPSVCLPPPCVCPDMCVSFHVYVPIVCIPRHLHAHPPFACNHRVYLPPVCTVQPPLCVCPSFHVDIPTVCTSCICPPTVRMSPLCISPPYVCPSICMPQTCVNPGLCMSRRPTTCMSRPYVRICSSVCMLLPTFFHTPRFRFLMSQKRVSA